jgi:heme exporter protein CcmD
MGYARAMGEHGLYVWSAYGAAILLLGGLVLLSVTARRRVRRQLASLDSGRKR